MDFGVFRLQNVHVNPELCHDRYQNLRFIDIKTVNLHVEAIDQCIFALPTLRKKLHSWRWLINRLPATA